MAAGSSGVADWYSVAACLLRFLAVFPDAALGKRGLMHVLKVSSQITMCSPHMSLSGP